MRREVFHGDILPGAWTPESGARTRNAMKSNNAEILDDEDVIGMEIKLPLSVFARLARAAAVVGEAPEKSGAKLLIDLINDDEFDCEAAGTVH